MTRLAAIVPLAAIVLNASAASAQSPLGSAQSFAVLGASIVTNTGPSVVTGDLGVSPATAVTGIPPGVVIGGLHAGDLVAARAQADAGIANAQLKALPCLPLNNLTGQVLGTGVLSLPPGVYCFDTSAQITGTLFLTGTGPWVFQIGTTLITASNAAVVVVDAGSTCSGANVFWQVGSSATLGAGTRFVGTILALASVTVMTGASVSGSVLALTAAVTLDTNAVSVCTPPVIPTNQSPVADAGPDQAVPLASLATLDGSASSDDGRLQTLSYSWVSDTGFSAAGKVATVLLPLGTHVFTLTVYDGEFSATDSVTITVLDATPPAIAIASPVANAAYALDQIVFASYTCTDASGIASCTGTAASGAQIDTSSPGPQPFCVTAVDGAGNTSTQCVSYSVLEPPTITVTSPIEPIYELGSLLLAQYSCAGAATCTGDVASGSALDTSTPGLKSFTITATDAAGNTTTQVVTYTVSLGSCVAPYAGLTAWLPGDGSAVESVTGATAIWTGTEAYGPGKVAQAFSVGSGRYVSLPFEQVGAFTLQAWVRAPDRLLPEFTGVLSTGGPAQKATSLQIELDGTGNYRLNVGDGDLSLLIGPALDFFQHVAVTFDGSTLTAYLNGQLVQSEVWAGSPGLGFHVLNVGIDRDGLHPFTGLVDEVQVFNRALSDEEVAQTFLTGASGLCTNRPQVAPGQSPLGSAQSFAVLGGSIVTNTGPSLVTGDLGVSPGTSVTGIPPGIVTGGIHAADLVAAQAKADARIAYDQLKTLACLPPNNLTGQVLGSTVLSLSPGVYCFDTSAQVTGTLALTGTGPWLFQIGSTLTTAANAAVVVADAGSTCSGANVFWQVGSSATLGTGTQFAGTILALASITVMNGASVSGSVLALTGAVTLDRNNVSVCQAPPANHPPVAVAVAAPNPAEATGPDGAIVSLDGTGSSDPDHDTLTCTWHEGATPLGTGCLLSTRLTIGSHAITLTVDDGQGMTAASDVVVVVRDTTGPALTVPPVVLAEATSPLGASVLYTASATDVVSGAVPITCAPASGSGFAIGSTVVTCSATDATGNIASATFNVIVSDTIAPEVQITSSADALLSGSTFAVVVLANDIVGVAAVTVNGIEAARTVGTAQAGTWVATVPVALPVAPGGVLRFDVRASDAAGNAGTATLLVDNDGIPAAMDRNRVAGIDESGSYSNDFVTRPDSRHGDAKRVDGETLECADRGRGAGHDLGIGRHRENFSVHRDGQGSQAGCHRRNGGHHMRFNGDHHGQGDQRGTAD